MGAALTRIHAGSRGLGRTLALGLALMVVLGGCKDGDDRPPREAPPNPAAPEPAPDPAAPDPSPAGASGARDRLLAWFDPDAISVAYSTLPERLKSDAIAVVYGLPPRAEDLLGALTDVDQALEAVRPSDAPSADTWLGTEGLVSLGRLAGRPTVLHPLRVSREEAATHLEALELRREADEVFEVWVPQRVFPYRVVLLEGDVAAFIPASEPGSGLAPLAAARDLPPSEAETQLTALLEQPDPPALALFAAGPMLHFDLTADVLMVRFELRRRSDGSLDGELALQVDGDPAAAVKALEQRKAPEQNDRIQQLVERAAYRADGPVVAGRLELPPADAALLRVSGSAAP